jgi:hypothetical protein
MMNNLLITILLALCLLTVNSTAPTIHTTIPAPSLSIALADQTLPITLTTKSFAVVLSSTGLKVEASGPPQAISPFTKVLDFLSTNVFQTKATEEKKRERNTILFSTIPSTSFVTQHGVGFDASEKDGNFVINLDIEGGRYFCKS